MQAEIWLQYQEANINIVVERHAGKPPQLFLLHSNNEHGAGKNDAGVGYRGKRSLRNLYESCVGWSALILLRYTADDSTVWFEVCKRNSLR